MVIWTVIAHHEVGGNVDDRSGSRREGIGPEIKRWRARRSLTQERLARAVGISTRHLSFIENDRSRPGREVLLRIASVLELPPRDRDQLLEGAGHARHRDEEPDAVRVLNTPEEVQAVADPLRLDLLRAFREPRSPMSAAELLGVPPTRVYHHVQVLERSGLIELVETRRKRGTLEKIYRSVASVFQLGESMAIVPPGEGGAEGVWTSLVEAMGESPRGPTRPEGPGPMMAAQAVVAVNQEDFLSLVHEIRRLFERYEAAECAGRTSYRFTIVGAPLGEKQKNASASP
jgi:transcriptional regulator with XRE-family HTH domain